MWLYIGSTLLIVALRYYKPPPYTLQSRARRDVCSPRSKFMGLYTPWSVDFLTYKPTTFPPSDDSVRLFWWLQPTFIDSRLRLLCEVCPSFFSHQPKNPYGRTGLCGRGRLKDFGPNWLVMYVHQLTNTHEYQVQTSWCQSFLTVLQHRNYTYRGYIDHPMNTDNAWVETVICPCKHDLKTQNILTKEQLMAEYPWLHDVDLFSHIATESN